MQFTQTICDVCKQVKGETNHWWKASINRNLNQFWVEISDAVITYDKSHIDLCSQQCVSRKLNEFMEEVTKCH